MRTQQFWGKASPAFPGPFWHPLPLHALDVAAVGAALLKQPGSPAGSLDGLLGWSPDEALPIICYLLALHDVGKFARRFQAKVPDQFPPCFEADGAEFATLAFDHGSAGLRLFDKDPSIFLETASVDDIAWLPLFAAVFGHHGAPPLSDDPQGLRADFGKVGIRAARRFVAELRELFDVDLAGIDVEEANTRTASHVLAGAAVLADWIGSNQRWFRYQEPVDDLEGYWGKAQAVADRALQEAGVVSAAVGPRISYGSLIDERATPTPMQEWAATVSLPRGGGLFLIEDETGSGKTEAATMLVNRLMRAGRATGVYVALPTMATANAMFDRLAATHGYLFAEDAKPSVALVHGARDLHRGFIAARLAGGRREAAYADGGASADVTASTACAEWIADDRRRAFLADVGVGTVDQALLAALPCRHQSLRLLGLSRRVLVIDEVHAYDAYMSREIERLLEFQAALGGSAILLSATLPVTVRKRLVEAFGCGLGQSDVRTDVAMEYPLATVQAADVQCSEAVAAMPGRGRRLPVRFLRSADEACDEIAHAARSGKAALYVRNTVDDVLDAHEALRARDVESTVFHARFALADRLGIEADVVGDFGKAGTEASRSGRVLVATQVVEQSLDLDFDVLVTDLAPMDLLIQRAGRLWRHTHRKRGGRPELVVVSPEPKQDAAKDWFSGMFPRAAYVYLDHARLWLTARRLADAGAIESPDGLRALVEAVYGDAVEDDVPEALKPSAYDAEGRAGAERSIANSNVLDVGTGYLRDGGAWDADVRTPTRLNDDPQRVLRLARMVAGRVVPYATVDGDAEVWRAWRLSEVNVPERRVEGERVPPQLKAAVADAKQAWGRYDDDVVLAVLQPGEGGALTSTVAGSDDREVKLTYSASHGLMMS